jgi:thiosulfate/3-mercaptopyruvate sulfurtransferase
MKRSGKLLFVTACVVVLTAWAATAGAAGRAIEKLSHTASCSPACMCSTNDVTRAARLDVAETDDPWSASQLISPDELAKLLSSEKKDDHGLPQAPRLLVLQVGVLPLYKLSRIPNSVYAGMASQPEGLDKLKKAADQWDRGIQIVLYCGCCPFNDCPNVRPAFKALADMGFKNLKVLNLPNNFTQDWENKGLPTDRRRG